MKIPTGRRALAGAALATTGLLLPVLASAPSPATALPPICSEPLVGGFAATGAAVVCPPPTTIRRPTTTRAPLPPNTATWFIDADTLKDIDNQETFSDEAYIAQIGFRSTPGVTGSTQVWYQGGLSEIGDLDEGETHTIPDAMGRVRFANVTSRSFTDVLGGRNPEVVGTLSVVFESDLTPFSSIDGLMGNVATAARPQIASVIEPLSLADLANPQQLVDRLTAAATNISNSASLSTWQAVKLFIGSAGDPDDPIAFKANVFAAVDGSLAPLVDGAFGGIPPEVGAGGGLRDRSYVQRFAGDGATYDVTYAVSH
jgi:hypothetical protein